jgi:DNA-binding NarL/FixJ family response regulator
VIEPRLLIVDDSADIRSWLRQIAEANHFGVAGEAETGEKALEMVRRLDLDLVLLDVSMPVMGGFETARHLKEIAPEVSIIFVSQHSDRAYVDEAFRLGARGYVLKSNVATELREAIECVLNNQTYRSARLATRNAGGG